MRFTSLIASLVLALTTLVTPSLAITAGITGSAATGTGKNRPIIVALPTPSTVVRVAQADTFMIGSARDSVTAHAISYTPFPISTFNANIPTTYQGVTSNKDSLVLCVIGYGDADSVDILFTLQARYTGTTNATSSYVSMGTGTLTYSTATTTQQCAGFRHPGTMDFRFLGVGQGSTDTTKVLRAQISDK